MSANTVVDMFYDALLEPDLWPKALQDFAETFSAPQAILAASKKDMRAPLVTWAGVEPSYQLLYATRFTRGSDPVHLAAGDRFIGTPFTDRMVLATHEFQETSFYQEWCRPQQIETVLGLDFRHQVPGVTLLGLGRDKLFSDTELLQYQALVPDLRRVFRLRLRLLAVETRNAQVRRLLDLVQVPIILADGRGELLHANERAEEIFRSGGAVSASAGRLSANSLNDADRLRGLIAQISGGGKGADLRLTMRNGEQQMLVLLALHPDHAWAEGKDDCVVIFITGPGYDLDAQAVVLKALYGLTPTEAAVATRVGSGEGLPATAKDLGIKVSTAKTHLQRIFEKTSCLRQSQLARLITSLPRAL